MNKQHLVMLHIAVLLAATPIHAEPGKHQLKKVRDGSVDLVASVDWDWNSSPTGAMSKSQLRDQFTKFGETFFRMTEGHVRICNIFVYNESSYADVADILINNEADRANAVLGGLKSEGQINMFTRKADGTSVKLFGQVLAHEFAHYGLSLGDEYQEKKREQSQIGGCRSLPWRCDLDLDTVMGVSIRSVLSLPGDYSIKDNHPWKLKSGVKADTKQTQQTFYSKCEDLESPTPAPGQKTTQNATWRTAQWRMYRQSAWEMITNQPAPRDSLPAKKKDKWKIHRFNSLAQLTAVPKALNASRVWDHKCFDVIFVEGTVVALVIDRSMSMGKMIGKVTKMDRAKTMATNLVNQLPSGHSVVIISFHSGPTVEVPLTEIEAGKEQAVRAKLIQAISALQPVPPGIGSTNVTSALLKTQTVLLQGAAQGNRQYVYLIADDQVAPDDWVLDFYAGAWIPIFANNAGSAVNSKALRKVATKTKGDYHAFPGVTLKEIKQTFLNNERIGIRTWPQTRSGSGPFEETFDLSEVDGNTAFHASWGVGDTVSFELKTPDGKLIKSDQLPSGVTYEGGPDYGSYILSSPKPGQWAAVLTPQVIASKSPIELDVRSDSPLRLELTAEGSGAYPEPWVLRARLGAPQPVIGAQVKATFGQAAGSTPSEIDLRDDGEAPDLTANDGVYTGLVSTLTTNGDYSLTVEASNPSGKATIDSAGVGAPGQESGKPRPLTALRRRASVVLKATSFRTMPQAPADAIQIRNDMTPLWGAIEKSGEVVWFRFNGYATGTYAVMTGELLSNDGKAMATKVTLYDEDGKTVLGSNAGSDGRAWVEYTAPAVNKKILIKVEHPGGGVGRFSVAVAPAEWFKQASSDADSGGEQGCSSCTAPPSGGGGAAVVLTLLALLALLARRRWS